MELYLESYLTAGVGVLALLLGRFLTGKVSFLRKVCIPAPVSGGLIFSLLTFALFSFFGIQIAFDGTLKDICMMIFFTSVGFQSDFSVIKKGGKPLAVMVALVAILIAIQNGVAVGIARLMGADALVGMAAGSIPMCGGHGTAGGFKSLLESMGLENAESITMACATFGLIAGSLIGGPLAESIIRGKKLNTASEDISIEIEAEKASPEAKSMRLGSEEKEYQRLTRATFQLLLAMALGYLISKALAYTGITFPTYFGSLIAAALMRNVSEHASWSPRMEMGSIVSIGNVCLSLFLGMAMISLRLWELSNLALTLVVILLAHILIIALFSRCVAFPLLGRDYDAAVLVSGLCGFGLGATPNAMANMSAVCNKYSYAVKPFIIVPLIGAMFVDIINTTIISLFLSFI